MNSSVNPETLKGDQRLRGINPECVTMGKRKRVAFTCSYTEVKREIESVKSQISEKNECKFSKKKKKKKRKISFTGHTDIVSYIQEKKYSVN